MKKLSFILSSVLLISTLSFADNYVNGYYKSNGTYVKGHYRSSPNSTKSDNYSTYGNTNPYTGQSGTKKYNNYNNYGNSKSNSYNYSYGK